ncbi:arabinan endo-1,5-alpha-L-arabinosidase [Rhizosphaericola mali]|uniref:Family 43 glycosylhydrolase n=1 Tax=Rhizosphaericola mali TaxID=2545455 RepID=A0A5P2G098_9BACT|nr:arabinan endo-1,5-alpha-L-arabinosidase [Rhizosphaericola mali]QES88647.1 family 43 glycosylhydrolase [Rhizosphaericola mali]
MNITKRTLAAFASILLLNVSCKKDHTFNDAGTIDNNIYFDINKIYDVYPQYASSSMFYNWTVYNVHDPSIKKFGDYYYCYSTDVAYGTSIRAGLQIRRSKDLVDWYFMGWVFDQLPAKGSAYIESQGATPNESLWAPYVMQVGNEYRLYYSLASNGDRISAIGLATATNPLGPWTEKGLVVTSKTAGAGTNAIDPTVVTATDGKMYLYYGSSWDGLFMKELNPSTGLAIDSLTIGTRIVRRGSTNGMINGNLEGPEIIYNDSTKMYYLFVAYDWLSTKYNTRVYRSSTPTGPFLDWSGNNVDLAVDHGPMIIAPYKFENQSGWAGVSHCSVFMQDGQYYIAHQGRPGEDLAYMDLHVRKLYWTSDGWPVASPERFANISDSTVGSSELIGNFEEVVLGYSVVPGFAETQTDPQYNYSFKTTLNQDGTINGDKNNTWTYNSPWLELHWGTAFVDKLHVSRDRDWENHVTSTIVLSGFNGDGTAIWMKKLSQ